MHWFLFAGFDCNERPDVSEKHRLGRMIVTQNRRQIYFFKFTSFSHSAFGPCSSSLYLSCSHRSVVRSHSFLPSFGGRDL